MLKIKMAGGGKMDRRTAIKVIGGSFLGIAGLGALA